MKYLSDKYKWLNCLLLILLANSSCLAYDISLSLKSMLLGPQVAGFGIITTATATCSFEITQNGITTSNYSYRVFDTATNQTLFSGVGAAGASTLPFSAPFLPIGRALRLSVTALYNGELHNLDFKTDHAEGVWCGQATYMGIPSAPTFSAITSNSVSVSATKPSFTAPSNANYAEYFYCVYYPRNNFAITSAIGIQYCLQGGFSMSCPGSKTVSSLTPNTTYDVYMIYTLIYNYPGYASAGFYCNTVGYYVGQKQTVSPVGSFTTPPAPSSCNSVAGDYTAPATNSSTNISNFYSGTITAASTVTQTGGTLNYEAGNMVLLNTGFVGTATGQGLIKVNVFNPANCIATNNLANVPIEQIDSVQQIAVNDNIAVYPNPTNSILNIRLKSSNNEVVKDVWVFDLSGRVILHQNNVNKVDISNATNGTYILKVTTNLSTFTRKILKM